MSQPKLWTKAFLLDTLANFIFYLVCYLLWVIMSGYAMKSLHASPGVAGILSGIFIVGGFLGRILTGRVIEQVGQKRLLYIGVLFYFVTTLFYFATTNLPLLLIVRFFHGIGFGIASTTSGTIIAHITPHERRGEGIGYYALSVTLASAFGPFIGMFLFQHGSFDMIVSICAVVLILSLIAAFFIKVPKVELNVQQPEKVQHFSLNQFFEKKAVPIALVTFFVGISYSSVISFLATYTQKIGLTDAGNFFYIVYAVFILISRPLTGRLFDKKGENFVMYPVLVLFAIGLVVINLAHSGIILLLSGILIGLGYGTYISCAQAIAVKKSPHHQGLATSTFFGFLDIGMGIGPLFFGLLIPMINYRGIYLCAAVVVIVCIFLYYVLHGRTVKSVEI